MPLIGFTGPMGSGKTLSMTVYAWLMAHFCKIGLFTNYDSFKMARPVKKWTDIITMEKGIFCFDEMPITMESRQSKENVKMTHWLVQTRKKKLFVFYTCQDPSMVDKRVRQNTDVMIWCSISIDKHTKKKFIRWTIIDWPRSQQGQWFILGYRKLVNVERFYKLYNHEQTISVIEDSQSYVRR